MSARCEICNGSGVLARMDVDPPGRLERFCSCRSGLAMRVISGVDARDVLEAFDWPKIEAERRRLRQP
jgi:hypothetical protein